MRRFTRMSRLVLAGAVVSATLAAACGGGDDEELVAVDVWVRGLCSAAARFDTASDEAGQPFVDAVDESPEDTPAIKEAFAEALEAQKEAQGEFRSEFEDLGKPDVEDPDAVIEAFREQFEENDGRTEQIGEDVAAIDDDEDFFAAFLEIDIDEPDFRAKLEPLADDDAGVQEIIDEIEANQDCAATIFDDEDAEPEPEPTQATNSDDPNVQWASGVCLALSGWIDDLSAANDELQAQVDRAADAEDLKDVLVAFLEQGLFDTQDFELEILALGPPDVTDGEEIQGVFEGAASDLVLLFDDLVSEASAIDASSLTAVTADLEEFEQRVGTAFDEVGAAFDELDQYDPEGLDQLFATLPECVAVGQ